MYQVKFQLSRAGSSTSKNSATGTPSSPRFAMVREKSSSGLPVEVVSMSVYRSDCTLPLKQQIRVLTIGSLRSVDRRMDLNANVKVLTGEEVLSIGGEDATQSWARSETLERLSRSSSGKAHSYSCRGQAEGDHDWLPDKGNEMFRVGHLDEETVGRIQL